MNQCASCRTSKSLNEFIKNDVSMKTCFSCRQYQLVHRQILLAKRNPERVKDSNRRHRLKKIPYYTEKNKEFREKNPDYQKLYYLAHKD